MDADRLRRLLEEVQSGSVDVASALESLKSLPFADLGYARIDHHRALRMGVPEVVLGEGKSVEQLAGIAQHLIESKQRVLITRLLPPKAEELCAQVPVLRYVPLARVATHGHETVAKRPCGAVAIVTAGTSDIPVAEEAIETFAMLGIEVTRVFDVGVAGIHRLLRSLDVIAQAPAVVVVAGMEGALPSVVAGMIGSPVIAVPTSVGYGAALGGMTALLGMLTGCASGVTVVNIDNGFGAAMAVLRIVFAEEQRRTV